MYWLELARSGSAKRLAWLLIPLFCIVLILVFFSQNAGVEQGASVQVVSTGDRYQRLIVHGGQAVDSSEKWQAEFITASPKLNEQILEKLSKFRADYQQLGPSMSVWADPGNETALALAKQLGLVLARYGLGKTELNMPARVFPGVDEASVVVRCAESQCDIARNLLAALAPMINGEFFLWFDPGAGVQKMEMSIFGKPLFNSRGEAYFGLE